VLLGSSILEVGLGLALFFLLLAIIVSSISEVIARILRLRASTLKTGIAELFGSDVPNLRSTLRFDPDSEWFVDRLYAHPIIQALERNGRPNYIRDRTFAAALIDTVAAGATTVQAVASALDGATIPGDLEKQLRILVTRAHGDMAKLEAGIEGWFNDSMDRVSGWYKRKAQVVTFVVAAIITIGLNADSLALANAMIQNPAAREAYVAQASALVPTAAGSGIPSTSVAEIKKAMEPLGLSLGWRAVNAADPVGWFLAPANWLGFVPGWLITTFAVLMGAPFWFDIVGRVANLRSSGNPPPKTSSATPAGD
jgi:hypothetical protein